MQSGEDIVRDNPLGRTNYIIYGSDAALCLFEVSPTTLMASDNSDFDVVRCTPDKPITSLLDDFVIFERYLFIDASIYNVLHKYRNQKMRQFFGRSTRNLLSGSR